MRILSLVCANPAFRFAALLGGACGVELAWLAAVTRILRVAGSGLDSARRVGLCVGRFEAAILRGLLCGSEKFCGFAAARNRVVSRWMSIFSDSRLQGFAKGFAAILPRNRESKIAQAFAKSVGSEIRSG